MKTSLSQFIEQNLLLISLVLVLIKKYAHCNFLDGTFAKFMTSSRILSQ